jgi:hypothetical protein
MDKILEELNKTAILLRQFRDTGNIPDIERDIVLSKLRNIYEFIQLVQPEKGKRHPVSEDLVMEETKQVPEAPPKTEVSFIQEAIPSNQPVPAQPGATAKKEILAEKFRSQNFLNEALAQYQNMIDVSKKIQSSPLTNISSAINLNDKFLFTKELFRNDTSLYQATIEKINNAESFNDAIRYLDENFTWDFNDPLVQKLLELVRRRYLHIS